MSKTYAYEEACSQVVEATSQPAIDLKSSDDGDFVYILHVDDDVGVLEVLKHILEMDGRFQVDTAFSVEEAFEKMEKHSYDAVISDYEMPAKNGLQFLKELREKKNNIPFVIFTGKGREEVAVKALNLGADGYFNKTGSTETVYGELVHGVTRAVEARRAMAKADIEGTRLSAILASSPEAITICDLDAKVINCSDVALKLSGYSSKKEIIGRDGFEFIAKKDHAKAFEALNRLVGQGKIAKEELTCLKGNGEEYLGELTVGLLKDNIGNPVGLVGILRDISERKKAEQTLKESERRYRSLFANMLNGFAYCRMIFNEKDKPIDFVYLEVNDAFEKLTGLKKEAVIGKKVTEAIPGTEKANPELFDIYGRVALTGKEERFEIFFKPLNVWLSISVYCPKKGYFVAIFENITKRRIVEKENMQKAEEFSRIMDGIGDLLFVMDKNRIITRVNKSTCDALKKKPEELLGKRCYEVVHGTDKPWPNCPAAKTYETREITSTEITDPNLGIPLLVTTSPILDGKGELVQCVHIAKDITERKKAEERLAKSKEFDERIIDSLDDALLVIDPNNYMIISVNEVAVKQLKLKREDLIGKTCYETTHHMSTPCQPPDHVCPIREMSENSRTVTIEHTHFDENNNERIVEVSARFVRNPEGKTVVIHVARDITERKQMETKLREGEKRYHALFNQAPFGILIIDAETATPVEFNKVAHEQLGYSREEFAKLRIFDYKAIETPDETKARIEKILREGRDEFETKHRTKNGDIRDVVVTVQAIELSGKTFLHSVYRDVTEAKKVENALMESEAKYRQLVELAQEGVWAIDNGNCTVFVNPRMAEMLGYSESEMMGKNLVAFLDKPDIDLASYNLERCKRGNQGQCEFEFIRKDGTHIFANVAASSIQDDTGNCIGTLALVADINERKKIEVNLKESRDRLEMTNEKLRVVGGLTRHDVRNKLCAVTGNAFVIKKKHGDQADIMDGLGKIEQTCKEIGKIFDFTKMYEQLGVEELTYNDVEKTLNEALALFSGSFSLKVINGCHGLTVLADSFLRQLFYNLIDNSLKHGEKVTRIRVYYEKVDKDKLDVVCEDDGMGIPAMNKPKLFKEGFSTGGTSGYGLFLIKKMIEVYGWAIQEAGEPNNGAKFIITIPRINKNGKENFQIT